MISNNLIKNNKFKIKTGFFLLPIVFWILLPALSFNSIFRILVILSCFSYFIIEFNRGIINKFSLKVIFLIFLIWSIHLLSLSQNPSQFFHLTFFFIIVIFSNCIILKKDSNYDYLIIVVLVLNLVTIIITLLNLFNDMNVSRALSKSNEISIGLSLRGIGGYGFVYMNVVLFPLFISYTKNIYYNNHNKVLLLISSLNILGVVSLVWKAQYMIALLIVILCLFLYFIRFALKNPIKTLFFITPVFFAASVYYLIKFEEIIEGTRYLQKYIGFLSAVSGDEANLSVTSRSDLYLRSIYTFLESPFTGNLRFSYDKIGAHSQIIDNFAQFGLFIGTATIYCIFYLPVVILKNINIDYKFEIILFIIALFIIALTNTVPLEISLSFLFLSLTLKNKNTI